MKDYYYILGVEPTATEQEIRTAYKKLSLKFHPDINDGDSFYEERFKEIQEAYDKIGDAERRAEYDQKRLQQQQQQAQQSGERPYFSLSKPVVQVFDCSKKSIFEGELITLTWRTSHADLVYIDPIGEVESEGTKTIRLPNLVGEEYVDLVLIATNTYVKKQSEKSIRINNKSFNPNDVRTKTDTRYNAQYDDEDDDDDFDPRNRGRNAKKNPKPPKKQPKKQPEPPRQHGLVATENERRIPRPAIGRNEVYAYILITVMMVLATGLGILVYKLNQG